MKMEQTMTFTVNDTISYKCPNMIKELHMHIVAWCKKVHD